jgi:processive 1,2-diacylglycerol beta-glucosyltransferase
MEGDHTSAPSRRRRTSSGPRPGGRSRIADRERSRVTASLCEPKPSASAPSAAPRVLILTASVGAGHDEPAETLAAQLRAEHPGADVVTKDALAAIGGIVKTMSADAPGIVFYRFQVAWDIGFWLFAECGPTRRATQALLTRSSAPGLLRLIAEVDPDVIVCTYPNITEVLGRLRRTGRLAIPVCAAITDLAALDYWASPGIDVHLVTHPESIPEVRRIAGAATEIHCVHGFSRPEFRQALDAGEARRALDLPEHGSIVLVSGGGWGVGDVAGAVHEALALDRVTRVVCLCGHNGALREHIAASFAGQPRVRVEGFTARMPEWMAAADVLVHSTCGLTVLEATMRGCSAISFGWGRGHVRRNDAALRRFGLAAVVGSRGELAAALERALDQARRPDPRFADIPSAASFVLATAQRPRSGA